MLKLTDLRTKRNLSKAELGRRAHLDSSMLSKVEAGRIRPYPAQLSRLAHALGLSKRDAPSLLEDADGHEAA